MKKNIVIGSVVLGLMLGSSAFAVVVPSNTATPAASASTASSVTHKAKTSKKKATKKATKKSTAKAAPKTVSAAPSTK